MRQKTELTEIPRFQPRCPSCREILDDDYVEALQRNTNELGLKCNLHKAVSCFEFVEK